MYHSPLQCLSSTIDIIALLAPRDIFRVDSGHVLRKKPSNLMAIGIGSSVSSACDTGFKGDAQKTRFLYSAPEQADRLDISKPRYNLDTFSGRLSHFYSVTSPLTLFASKAQLQDARRLVEETELRLPSSKQEAFYVSRDEAERYWKAKQLVQSSVHPDTGEAIPLPFRMSAFVPTNLLVVGGMLRPTNGLTATIFWQWVNQSLNVCVNYR